jgi:hypothetical protein
MVNWSLETRTVEVEKLAKLFLAFALVTPKHRPECHFSSIDFSVAAKHIHSHTFKSFPEVLGNTQQFIPTFGLSESIP